MCRAGWSHRSLRLALHPKRQIDQIGSGMKEKLGISTWKKKSGNSYKLSFLSRQGMSHLLGNICKLSIVFKGSRRHQYVQEVPQDHFQNKLFLFLQTDEIANWPISINSFQTNHDQSGRIYPKDVWYNSSTSSERSRCQNWTNHILPVITSVVGLLICCTCRLCYGPTLCYGQLTEECLLFYDCYSLYGALFLRPRCTSHLHARDIRVVRLPEYSGRLPHGGVPCNLTTMHIG